MRKIIFILYSFLGVFSFAQESKETLKEAGDSNIKASIDQDSVKYYTPTIYSYKYWTEDQPKMIFDTVLTVDKYYRNRTYNHKDYFGTMPSSNIGQASNPLLYTANISSPIDLVPYGKSFNLIGAEEVRYFDVQTPMAEFQYNNGYKQGHSLSSLFTHNINSRLNYSIQYKGLRSQGKYLDQLASHNTILMGLSYQTKNNRYRLWTHYMVATENNEENGGIKYLEAFESGDSRFKNRNRLEVNLTDANSKYQKRRFYIGQKLGIINSGEKYPLSIKNIFSYETTHYTYDESKTANDYFTSDVFSTDIAGHYNTKKLRKFSNISNAVFEWSDKLHFEAGLKYEHLEFSADKMADLSLAIPKNVKDDRVGINGNLSFNWKEGIKLKTQAEALTGDQFKNSYFINNLLTIQPINNYYIEANLGIKSQIPSLNMIYNQSFYKDFNYYMSNPDNERIIQAGGALRLKPFNTRVSTQFFDVNKYTYIDENYQPQQVKSSVNIMQVGLQNSFQYRKFHLETRFAYQKVTNNKEVLPLPEFVGRATFYYQSKIFKNNAELQAGINAYYFSKFKSREFFPVTNEFILQKEDDKYNIGEYPVLDIFLHFKVKRMLIILEGQHFNSSFTGYKFYSSPRNPYSDFRLNVGILWYIFT